MRRPLSAILGWAAILAACTPLPAFEQPPVLPAGVYGMYQDNDTGAINQSAWAFASARNTQGNPIDAIRAIVALEYLPAELRNNPRWIEVEASIPLRLSQAREDLRQIVGIRPDAPSQLVINALLALSWNLSTGSHSAAMQVLTSPIFTKPPQVTMATLSHLPYVQAANFATANAEMQAMAGGNGR